MTVSPPGSPTGASPRLSAVMRTPRSNSRLSMSSKHGGGSRASDEDAKTAVKVAVRVRPPLKSSDPGFELIPQRFQRSMVHVTAPTSVAVDVPQGRKLFVFDRVFAETVDQQGVWEYLSESVNSFLQGYNVSLLAYGQSGAGKSYTMGTSGPKEQSVADNMGVIPRAAQELFEKLDGPSKHNRNSSTGLRTPSRYSMGSASSLKGNADKNWQLKATYVEIYNEQLRDLLLPDSTPVHERPAVTIREDTKGRIILTGLHQVNINCFDDLIGALNFGSSIRQTDSTAINAKSSRSHAVFSLNLVQRNKTPNSAPSPSSKEKRLSAPVEPSAADPSVTVDSKLHFVDLAGSERLKNTGASGERAREGISINAGLAALGKVISQLSSRQSGSHVSYRDSKLTRLLQDSLGGNAYTYMIACVTPAEFHLSETLNTVQYAQRARAIQSKPRIQQVADESDKHALIERLKAEVAFLRQQLRNAEDSDRRTAPAGERSAERQNGKEIDLQNQLLDVHESYNALSQRHAKLVSEMARDSEQQPQQDQEASEDDVASTVGKSSMERLKRSHSFAESVEQVVLEYEKTIQSLESSLSNTRSSLSVTESTLLERETKCTYAETMNSQLQARIQKLLDRESSTEAYLHELESKLDGQSSGEEQRAAVISELRKELTRARSSEVGCEEYITTLEERLAEADQDMELMQREVERLEHVVERQRSLGKLDNLLHELDHTNQNGGHSRKGSSNDVVGRDDIEKSRAMTMKSAQSLRKRATSLDVLSEAAETAIPESDDGMAESGPTLGDEMDVPLPVSAPDQQQQTGRAEDQSRFMADKLDTVSQELIDLRMQHDSTLNDYELLEAKYEAALKSLTEARENNTNSAATTHGGNNLAVVNGTHLNVDDSQSSAASTSNSRPVSFLEDTRAPTDSRTGTQHSFSRSLSSELSLVGESATSPEASNASEITKKDLQQPETTSEEDGLVVNGDSSDDVVHMRRLLSEHEEGVNVMNQKYEQLQQEHEGILGVVETLKAELQRKSSSPPSTPSFKSSVIRRKTSQSLMSNVDRAHRSINSLRNLAADEFQSQPDTMQNFEVHLDSALLELNNRVERIQSLEAENQSVKKEMEMKSTIISGLTRERSSMQGGVSSLDMGLVTQLRDQIVQQEKVMAESKASQEAREMELQAEIEELKGLLQSQEAAAKSQDAGAEVHEKRIGDLEQELAAWQGKHQSAVDSLQLSEQKLGSTYTELETALASVDAVHAERTAAAGEVSAQKEAEARDRDGERADQQGLVDNLTKSMEEHKATIAGHVATIAALEKSHSELASASNDNNNTNSRSVDDNDNDKNATRIAELERDMASHQEQLSSLQDSHKRELEELEQRTKAAAQAEYESQLAAKSTEHDESITALRGEIVESRDELVKLLRMVSGLLKTDVTSATLSEQLEEVLAQKQHFSDRYAELMDHNEDLRKQVEAKSGADTANIEEANRKAETQEKKLQELALLVATTEETVRDRDEQIRKKNTLVEELEEQITNSYDQHHNRLSTMQQEREQALVDAKLKIAAYEKDIETYHMRIEQLELQVKNNGTNGENATDRTSSMNSNLRKSTSAATLPSPPPAIPLPPLPNIASQTNGSNISPPSSRHTSKELVNSQIVEDQEARIKTIEKHLYAEKQLTATLEEALGDLEAQSNKVKSDCEAWKKKAYQVEEEISSLRKERTSQRMSLQTVEEERNARREAEAARAQLEERMNALNKKKKKSTLNCF